MLDSDIESSQRPHVPHAVDDPQWISAELGKPKTHPLLPPLVETNVLHQSYTIIETRRRRALTIGHVLKVRLYETFLGSTQIFNLTFSSNETNYILSLGTHVTTLADGRVLSGSFVHITIKATILHQ